MQRFVRFVRLVRRTEAPARSQRRPALARRAAAGLTAAAGIAALAACGGGSSSTSSSTSAQCQASAASSAVISLSMSLPSTSALRMLRALPADFALARAFASVSLPATTTSPTSSIQTFTPQQIRNAYAEQPLPISWNALSAAQQAQMGAGQTVYIVTPYDDPELAAELAAFSGSFGLPSCTTVSIATSAALPLAAASASAGCTLSVVYTDSAGAMSSTVPSYNSYWAGQTAMQAEWAHATAPLARLIVVETPGSPSTLIAAVSLVDTLGAGVVSMDWGWTEVAGQSDSMFSTPDMSYVSGTANAGGGTQPVWPAVVPQVLAVGGTSLISYASAPRDEIAWTDTGSGTSQYTALPSYQSVVSGLGSYRSVADVSMDADSNTGQYYQTISPSAPSTANFYAGGGTALPTAEWAGVIAVADALRAYNGESPLGSVPPWLYPMLGNASQYAQAFNDIIAGSNGSCSSCAAATGYDQATGLGTPKVAGLLGLLTAGTGVSPPQLSSPSITSSSTRTLQFSLGATSTGSVSWALINAPVGMDINASSGTLTWYQPVAGSYAPVAIAADTTTGLVNGTTLSLTILPAASAPTVQAVTLSAAPGQTLSYGLQTTAPNQDALQYALSGAPSGMTVSSTGLLSWPAPVAGSYAVTATVTDSVTGLTASATITVQVSTTPGPVLTGASLSTTAGTALSGVVAVLSDSGATQARISIQGAATGMSFQVSGQDLVLSWPQPSCGVYDLTITATDSTGLSTQTQVAVQATG